MSLFEIQQQLKAPKNQKNSFGNYKYRSCEDILEAVKPILKELKMDMIISDEMVEVGGRVYVKAVVKLFKGDKEVAKTSASARESLTKKGMDESQITGAASSYARKYALNGLFLIDDTKDADTMDNRDSKQAPKKAEMPKTSTPRINYNGIIEKLQTFNTVEEVRDAKIKTYEALKPTESQIERLEFEFSKREGQIVAETDLDDELPDNAEVK